MILECREGAVGGDDSQWQALLVARSCEGIFKMLQVAHSCYGLNQWTMSSHWSGDVRNTLRKVLMGVVCCASTTPRCMVCVQHCCMHNLYFLVCVDVDSIVTSWHNI